MSRTPLLRLLGVMLVAAPVMFVGPGPAESAYPGTNGLIAFVSDRDDVQGDIYKMNAADRSLARCSSDGTREADPAWSPDGTQIAFSSLNFTTGDERDIYVMDADCTNVRRITNNRAFPDVDPTWSPDGRKIAFMSDRDNGWDIYVIDLATGVENNLTRNPTTQNEAPAWSPDGTRIAFESQRDNPFGEIYVMDAATGDNLARLTDSQGSGGAAWSPDSSKIAYKGNYDGQNEIYVLDLASSANTNLTNNPGQDSSPAWSPDGNQIAFLSFRDGNAELYVMNADGNDQTRLTTNGAFDLNPDWQPLPAPVRQFDVTVTGSQALGSSSPTFEHSENLPAGLSLTGALACTGLSGGAAISSNLPAGSYIIDGPTCSGLTVTGAGASGVTLAYIGGAFIVRAPSQVVVTVTGSQSSGSSSPTFSHTESPPAGISVTGSLRCTGLANGAAISSSLPEGSYTIAGSTCSGLALSGAGASGYEIVYVGGAFTVSEAPGPCVIVSPSSVDYGTHAFSRPSQPEVDERTVTIKSCATGGASQRVQVVGTEPIGASGPAASWELASAQDAFCPALNRASLELDRVAGGDQVVQWVTTSNAFLPVTWAPDESKDFRLLLIMPCQGSRGAGETRTTLITFTAVVP